jgi:Hemingway/CFA97
MNYESRLVSHWEREISTRIHKQKLEKIKKREFKALSKSFQPQNSKKNTIDRLVEISRENRILYDKLLQISERKTQSTNIKPTPSKIPNVKYKRLEADRIVKENTILFNKLSNHNSELSLKRMAKNYEVISGYRDLISRKNFEERIKKAVKLQTKLSSTPTQSNNKILVQSVSTTPTNPKTKTLLIKHLSPQPDLSAQNLGTKVSIIDENPLNE